MRGHVVSLYKHLSSLCCSPSQGPISLSSKPTIQLAPLLRKRTMKIFNWMHRKLHPATDYSLVSYNKDAIIEDGRAKGEPRSAPCEGERDKEALLLNHMLDGFLTIGTLGHGHGHGHPVLLPSIQEEQGSVAEGLLRVVAPAPLAEARCNPTVSVETKEERVVVEEEKKRVPVTVTVTATATEEPMRPSCEILEPLLMEERKKMDNGRTTLADLLAADGKKSPPVAASGGKKQASRCTKCSKKLPNKWKDPPPTPPPATVTKKLHRLMSRMMKKKIHPDAAHVRGGAPDATAAGDEGRLLPRNHIETT